VVHADRQCCTASGLSIHVDQRARRVSSRRDLGESTARQLILQFIAARAALLHRERGGDFPNRGSPRTASAMSGMSGTSRTGPLHGSRLSCAADSDGPDAAKLPTRFLE
jgi:hypothetical protein